MKEKRNIQIDLDTARNWYLSEDSFKQELALKAFSKEELKITNLPKSWEEFTKGGYLSSGYFGYSNKLDVLERLLILRDIYRQGWKPDWNDSSTKYTIEYHFNYIITDSACNYSCGVFSFPTKELAERFLENFKEELEQLKELL